MGQTETITSDVDGDLRLEALEPLAAEISTGLLAIPALLVWCHGINPCCRSGIAVDRCHCSDQAILASHMLPQLLRSHRYGRHRERGAMESCSVSWPQALALKLKNDPR